MAASICLKSVFARRSLRFIFFVVILVLTASGYVSRADAELRVFVSIAPEADFVERIAGSGVAVNVLVGPGQNHHTFEPTPKQMADMAGANVYFSIGLPFEKRLLEKIRSANPSLKCVDVSSGVAFRVMEESEESAEAHGGGEHEHGAVDPHCWLSPGNAKIIAMNICAAFKDVAPERAPEFERGLVVLLRALDDCDARVRAALAPYKGRSFYVYHPAFGYFADAYGLRQIPVELEGKEPTAKQLADLIERAKKEKVRMIFVQRQFPSKAAEAIAKEVGGAVVPLDPLARDYIANYESMAERLGAAFN
jgi:zinc transport system substrate-binding protein